MCAYICVCVCMYACLHVFTCACVHVAYVNVFVYVVYASVVSCSREVRGAPQGLPNLHNRLVNQLRPVLLSAPPPSHTLLQSGSLKQFGRQRIRAPVGRLCVPFYSKKKYKKIKNLNL